MWLSKLLQKSGQCLCVCVCVGGGGVEAGFEMEWPAVLEFYQEIVACLRLTDSNKKTDEINLIIFFHWKMVEAAIGMDRIKKMFSFKNVST